MRNLVCLFGASGSGKSSIADILSSRNNVPVYSYTTRPMRYSGERGHIFVSDEVFNTLEGKLLIGNYDGYKYCCTERQLYESDVIILEPDGVAELQKYLKDNTDINLVTYYIKCSREERENRMRKRGDKEENIKKRLELDDKRFSKDSLSRINYTVLDNEKTGALSSALTILEGPLKRFRLLCDMDDVIENLIEVWLKVLNIMQKNNPDFIPIEAKDIKSWNFTDLFPMLSKEEVFAPLETDVIWKLLRPIKGAQSAIASWQQDPRIDFRLVTSSHYTSIVPKREFLRRYFPSIKWNQVVIAAEKQYVSGEALIDDYENNLIGGNYKGILFTYPRNKDFNCEGHAIEKASSWDEIEKIVEKMVNEFFDEKTC